MTNADLVATLWSRILKQGCSWNELTMTVQHKKNLPNIFAIGLSKSDRQEEPSNVASMPKFMQDLISTIALPLQCPTECNFNTLSLPLLTTTL
jgi:hypothetical protein